MEAVVKQARTIRHPCWWHATPTWTPVISDGARGEAEGGKLRKRR